MDFSNGQIASLIANVTTKSSCCKPVSSGSFGLPGGESWHGVVPEWVSEPDSLYRHHDRGEKTEDNVAAGS